MYSCYVYGILITIVDYSLIWYIYNCEVLESWVDMVYVVTSLLFPPTMVGPPTQQNIDIDDPLPWLVVACLLYFFQN